MCIRVCFYFLRFINNDKQDKIALYLFLVELFSSLSFSAGII